MIKKLLLLFWFLPIAGCTSQVIRGNIVQFENICTESLRISTENSSNFYLSKHQKLLAPGEKAIAASYMAYTESIFEQVQSDYKLVISSKDNTLEIGRNELFKYLENVKPVLSGNNKIWVFSEESLCTD